MPRFRNKYEYEERYDNPRHVWTCVGRHGAIHFHVVDLGEKWGHEHGDRYSGGIEIHYRSPPDYMANDVPSHDKCWLLGCPCWHDGSSLYASETLIPRWLSDPHDHNRMFRILETEYLERFEPKSETADAA